MYVNDLLKQSCLFIFFIFTETRTDLVIETAEDGAVSLLKKWPDMKSKLHVCFNQPLPDPIRQLAWHLYLNDPRGIGTL